MSIFINPIARVQAFLAHKGIKPFIKKTTGEIGEGASVLLIGSGGPLGRLLDREIRKKTSNFISFDIDPDRNPDILGDITTHDFKDQKFDTIFMLEVLEHIRDPHLTPPQLHKILNTGGKLYLSTPFIFPLHDQPHDYYRFTRYGLEHLFKNFSKVEIQERNSWAESINVLFTRIYKEKTIPFRILGTFTVALAVLLQPLFWLLGKLFKNKFMTSGYVMVAEK